MEIVLKGSIKISMSPRKFSLSNIVIKEVTPVSDLQLKNMYDRVSVRVKVNKVTEPTEVPTGKKKQDVIVDSSGSCKCVLWEEKIESLNEGDSYLLKNFVVQEYGTKYSSMAKEGCEIVAVKDIGETVDDDEVLQDENEVLTNAEIVGVASLEQYKSCLRCKGRVEPTKERIRKVLKRRMQDASKI